MKKWTKVFSLVLAVAMVFCLFAACGDNGDDVDENGLKTLLIGGIGPLTGDYANYGTSVYHGAQIAVNEINAAHPEGINGYKLELSFMDSAASPDQAVSSYGSLVDKGMKVSLGGVLSGECAAVVAAAKEDGFLVLTPSGSAVSAIEGSDNAFRVCFSDPAQGKVSADYISEKNLAKKVAVFYGSDNDYCVGLYDTFKAECAVKGIEIVEVQTFTATTNTDFSTQIDKIEASGAELVFLPIYAAEASSFLSQAKAKGKLTNMVKYGCDGLDGILTKIDDPTTVNGVMMLTPFAADSTDAKVQNFVNLYKTDYNATPDQFAADGYDAIYTIVAALQKAGITADNADDFNSRLVAAMTQITVEGVTGKMTWTPDGEPTKSPMAMVYQDGTAKLAQ